MEHSRGFSPEQVKRLIETTATLEQVIDKLIDLGSDEFMKFAEKHLSKNRQIPMQVLSKLKNALQLKQEGIVPMKWPQETAPHILRLIQKQTISRAEMQIVINAAMEKFIDMKAKNFTQTLTPAELQFQLAFDQIVDELHQDRERNDPDYKITDSEWDEVWALLKEMNSLPSVDAEMIEANITHIQMRAADLVYEIIEEAQSSLVKESEINVPLKRRFGRF